MNLVRLPQGPDDHNLVFKLCDMLIRHKSTRADLRISLRAVGFCYINMASALHFLVDLTLMRRRIIFDYALTHSHNYHRFFTSMRRSASSA